MTTVPSTTTSIPRTCPFVGPRSFRFGEPLFGRDREVPKILDLLIAERIVLLFSPSGAGKTSLIQAGLIPALREEGFYDLPIIRVKQPTPSGEAGVIEPLAANRYLHCTLASLESRRPEAAEAPPTPLGDLDALEPALQRWGDTLRQKTDARAPRLVLIYDQFEEVLTTDPTDHAAKERFFDQLGSALKDPGLWALFAMREEYVAALEPYLNRIPRRLSSRFRLDLLDANAARQAFESPFESQGIAVTPDAMKRLIADLSAVRTQRPDGTTEVVGGPYVEPVHLQIVGLRLWNRFAGRSDFDQLDETHVGDTEGSVDTALASYFADKVQEIGATHGVGERSVRVWCECQLLTDQGLRGQVLRQPGQTRGLPEPAIKGLIDAFLVRAEDRRGSIWYELAHDRLIEPIRENNRQWRQKHLHPSLLRATDWDRGSRLDSLLLRDRELAEVTTWARVNDAILSDVERDFLRISHQAWDEEQSRRRRVAFQSGTLAIIVILLAVSSSIGYFWRKAVTARDAARLAEENAVSARDAARLAEDNEKEQRQIADRLALDAKRRTTELTIDRGITFCQQGRTDDGLLWLLRGHAQVHEMTPPDPTLDHLARLAIAAWRTEITSLRWFHQLGGPVRTLAFSPDQRTVMTGSENKTARLWDIASGQQKGPRLNHDAPVNAVAFSPDGRTLLTGSEDKTARLWDLATGQQKGPSLKHEGWIHAVAFSPDGRLALTGSEDKTAQLWDVASGQKKGSILNHDEAVDAVAFSPDGRTVLTGCEDGKARFWDVASELRKGPTLKHDGAITLVAFNLNGDTILTGSKDWTARLWDAETGRPKGPPMKHDVGWVIAGAFSPDGRTALTGGNDRTARFWDVETGRPKGPSLNHDGLVRAVAFSRDGRTALTGSYDGAVQLWDIALGRKQGPPLHHKSWVESVAFSPDGRILLTGSKDKTAQLWDVASGKQKGPTLNHGDRVYAVAFSPDGRLALTASWDTTARLWDVDTGRAKPPALKHDAPVSTVAFSPRGDLVLTGSVDTTARLWDVTSGKQKGAILKHDGPVGAVAFSPDGHTVLTGSDDKRARLWSVATGQQEGPFLEHKGPIDAVAFSPDGRTVLTGSDDRTARLWDVATGKQKALTLNHDGPVWVVAFSPDGHTVMTGSWDATARLWDAETGKPKGLPLNQGGSITDVAFSPDSKLVLTSARDGAVSLWLAETQKSIGALFSHRDTVEAATISPDGQMIATASWDGTAQIWRTPRDVECPQDRLAAWVSVITKKVMDESNTIHIIHLDTWDQARQKLDRLGGPPDQPGAIGAVGPPAR